MSVLRSVIMVALAFAASLVGAPDASAQSYPQRTVRFILPFGPGSGVDITARLVGGSPCRALGQAGRDRKPTGGDGLVAINAFTSANDDHTLLLDAGRHFHGASRTSTRSCPTTPTATCLPIANVTTLIAARASVPASLTSRDRCASSWRSRARKPNKFNVAAASRQFRLS